MAEITPAQVHYLLTAAHEYLAAADKAAAARHALGVVSLGTVRQAKVGLRELTAVTGLHPSTIRSAIRRAIGPRVTGELEQPELNLSGSSVRAQPEPYRSSPLAPSPQAVSAAPSL